MPRCNLCNGCLNHKDGYNCRKCKWCLDSKREGGPNRLRKPCRFRTCIQSKGGEDVKRMNGKGKKNIKSEGKGNSKKVLRRDSGFEQGKGSESGDSRITCTEEQVVEEAVVEGTGRDSGVGSHDGEGRDWGRKVVKKCERRLVGRMARLVEELAQSTSGQVSVVFQPGHHPNLPGVQADQTVLCFPGGQAQAGLTSGDWQVEGDHLARLGMEEGDVLACRMPDLHTGSQVVVSVGLGLDLARLGNRRKQNKERVVTWLLALLELSFPDKLRSSAVDLVWEMLEENLEYVGECGVEEANQFSGSVLELPEDVAEMASIAIDEEVPDSHSESPISASQLDLTGLSLNTTALDQAVDSMLLGQPVHGEDDNYSYTATVLDMDQIDLDSLTSLMTPNRLGSNDPLLFQSQTPGHHDQLLLADSLLDFPPLPHLPNNLELTPLTTTPHYTEHTTTPTITDENFSFSFSSNTSNTLVPVTLDTTNMVTIKAVTHLHRPPGPSQVNSPSKASPMLSPVGECDSEGRPSKRARKEPSRFKDYTSPVLR
jgi:hypothetical protein